LSSADYAFSLFGENAVDVEVETCEIVTQQDQCTIPERADVDFWRGTRIETANVTKAYGGFVPLPGQYDSLKSGEDLAGGTLRRARYLPSVLPGIFFAAVGIISDRPSLDSYWTSDFKTVVLDRAATA